MYEFPRPAALSLGALALLFVSRAAPSAPAQSVGSAAGAGPNCARTIVDASSPGNCLAASSVPTLGRLYPMSDDLNVNASGNVGVGTTSAVAKLEVNGSIGTTNSSNAIKALVRPGLSPNYGVVETYGSNAWRTVLLTTVSGIEDAGAIATEKNNLFLTIHTTAAVDPNAGYMSVFSSSVETAGMNGATGIVFGASKSFVQPHPTDATKEIQYISLEGPEHGVYFRGSASLVGGEAVIEVPESFRLVARADEMTVTATPTGASRGLYVASKGLDRIVVRENPGGTGDVAFDFHVMGERSAMPDHEPVRDNVHFAPKPGTDVPLASLPGRYGELMRGNGTLTEGGVVVEETARALGWSEVDGRWSGGPSEGAPLAERDR